MLTSAAIACASLFGGVFLSKGWQIMHIVVARVLQWTAICVERVEVESAQYVVVSHSESDGHEDG